MHSRNLDIKSFLKMNSIKQITKEVTNSTLKNEDEMTDQKLKKKVLFIFEKWLEKKKLLTGDLILSSFEGEAMLPEEFRRLFRQALQSGLNDRQLQLAIQHFDKDGDGSIDFIEVQSQLVHPHRLTQSTKKNQEEKFQEAMKQIRIKAAMHVDHGINRITGEKKKFDLKVFLGTLIPMGMAPLQGKSSYNVWLN